MLPARHLLVWASALFITSMLTACRRGDPVVCEQAATCSGDLRSVAEAVIARQSGDTCESAVDDVSCGLDFERFQRCINELVSPLCYDPGTQDLDQVLGGSACAELAQTAIACLRDAEARRSSADDDDD